MKKRVAPQPAPNVNRAADRAADRRTRDRVARLLLEQGSATASQLGEDLGLTAAAIRRHLDAMLDAGTIVARDARPHGKRMRGRPAKVFALSPAGHAAGPSAYDEFAVAALRYLRDAVGDEAVEQFARQRIAGWEDRYAQRIEALPLTERPTALAAALTADGFTATVHEGGCGVQLCQHHCPVQAIAEEFPVLCEVETEAIGRLTGRHVQRLATIAHGDGVCTTHIPLHEMTTHPVTTHPTTTSGRTAR